MALNSTGKLSLGGTVEGESVNLELGLVAGATNSMVSAANQLLTGKTTGPWVFPDDWRGKSNFILAFGNSDTFDVRQTQVNALGFAFLTFNGNGSITKIGNTKSQGPNSWLYPIRPEDSNYEIRLIVDAVDTSILAFSSFSFGEAGDVPAPTTTAYYNLGSPGAGTLTILSGTNRASSASGTVEIRRAGFGTPFISRAFYIYASGLNYNETVTSSSYSVKVGDTHSISIAGGVPNTVVNTFKHPTNFPIGARQAYTLDSSGNYTITGIQYATAGSWQWDFNFVATEATRTFNVAVEPTYSPTITLQDSFVGTQNISWSVASGPPNGTFSYEFRDPAGVYASGTGNLDASGGASITTSLGQPETPATGFGLTVGFTDANGTLTNTLSDSISWSVPVATYSVTPASSSVDEGSSLTFNVTTTNVPNGTTLYWAYNGGSADPVADLTAYNGSFTINNLGQGTFTVTTTADTTTEGSETFAVGIRTVSVTGIEVAVSGTITINDTSTTPAPCPVYGTQVSGVADRCVGVNLERFIWTGARDFESGVCRTSWIVIEANSATCGYVAPATYAFATYSTSVNEGGSITFTVNTTNIANGTNLSWAVSRFSDIDDPTGTFAINSNTGQFSINITADASTEGSETFTVNIYAGMTLVLTSNAITINDTSTTPAPVNPAAGTILSQGCVSGTYTYRITKADGSGGSYNEDTPNSATCGYVAPPVNPAAGTILSQGCVSGTYTYRVTKADGSGGSYNEDTPNSATCGYVAPPTYSPTITLQDSFVGNQDVSWSVASGPPNGTYSYEFRDPAGMYATATGNLDASGGASITTALGQPETPATSFSLTVGFFNSSGTLTNTVTDTISWSVYEPPPGGGGIGDANDNE